VGSSDEDGGSDEPIVPFEPSGGEGECRAKWTREPERTSELAADPNLVRAKGGDIARLQRVATGSALKVTTPAGVLNWVFIPYVHHPSAKQMRAFDQALADAFGSNVDKKDIVARAKEADIRNKLRDCYDAIWLDHNLITMTLYSGPLKQELAKVSLSGFQRHVVWLHTLSGWMLTGDAHLDGKRRRDRFLRFYKRFTSLTHVLMLPHHGSIHNHSDLVLDAMPNLVIGYAAAGSNSYGHPHRDVENAVNGHGRAYFHCVSEESFSKIVMNQVL